MPNRRHIFLLFLIFCAIIGHAHLKEVKPNANENGKQKNEKTAPKHNVPEPSKKKAPKTQPKTLNKPESTQKTVPVDKPETKKQVVSEQKPSKPEIEIPVKSTPSSKKKGHLEYIGNSGNIGPIDSVTGFLSPKIFINEYLLKNRPLLMKGAGKVSPAFSLWSDAYLRSKTPDGPNGNVDTEIGKKESRTAGTKILNFKEFLDIYNTTDIYMVNGLPHFLKPDVIYPWSLQCEDLKENIADIVTWFSSGGTKSVLHHDSYENINCLYRGTKRLVMINTTQYTDLEPKIIDKPNGAYSSINVESVDLDKYPFMSGIQFYEANMEPGDCLYIPLLWMHHVVSFGSNLAVNVWWDSTINKKIDQNKCNKNFDKSITLADIQIDKKMTEEENPTEMSDEEYFKTMDNILANVKFLVFTSENEDVKPAAFLIALTGEEFKSNKNLKTAAMKLMKIFYKTGSKSIIESDFDNLTEKKLEKLLTVATKFDEIAQSIGLDTLLTKGILPGAEDLLPSPTSEANDQGNEDEYTDEKKSGGLPFFENDKVYKDLGPMEHTEL